MWGFSKIMSCTPYWVSGLQNLLVWCYVFPYPSPCSGGGAASVSWGLHESEPLPSPVVEIRFSQLCDVTAASFFSPWHCQEFYLALSIFLRLPQILSCNAPSATKTAVILHLWGNLTTLALLQWHLLSYIMINHFLKILCFLLASNVKRKEIVFRMQVGYWCRQRINTRCWTVKEIICTIKLMKHAPSVDGKTL